MTNLAEDRRARALRVVRAQLAEGTAAKKCHTCGCFQETVRALETNEGARADLGDALARAREVFGPKAYDCLGCAVCHPAIAANAFAEGFPGADAMDLCPTDTPEAREGWPPLPGDYRTIRYAAPVAVCTLNDGDLAAGLADAAPEGLAIVGTLHTENLGIERLIKNVLANPNIRFLLLCGDDTKQAIGHLPGQSLESLFANGADERGRIRGARGKRPVLKNVTREELDAFLRQVRLVSMIGEKAAAPILDRVRVCAEQAEGPFEAAAPELRLPALHADEPTRLVPDPAGYLVIYPEPRRRVLRVEHFTNDGVFDCAVEGTTPAAVYAALIEQRLVSRLDHAAYLGRELARAERSLDSGEPYVQDRAAGEIEAAEETPTPSCGCSHPCGTGGT